MTEDKKNQAHVIGTCGLCKKESALLQDSHLLPKHIYRSLDSLKAKGTAVQMKNNKNDLFNLGRQVTQYLLCSKCEGEFSIRGEDYFGKVAIPRGGKMAPIFDDITKLKDGNLSPSDVPNIKSLDLYYFALSMVWRACQAGWPNYDSISVSCNILISVQDFLNPEKPDIYPDGLIVEVCVSPPKDLWSVSFPAKTKAGDVFFSYLHLEFWVRHNPALFDVYSRPIWGGAPVIYKLSKNRSDSIATSLQSAYENANSRGKLNRLGLNSK